MAQYDPINYGALQKTEDPLQSFGSGFQVGSVIQQVRAEQQAKAQAAKLLADKTAAFTKVAQNPTADGITQLSILYPDVAEKLKAPFDQLEKSQQAAKMKTFIPAYAAVLSGNHDVAIDTLQKYADAHRNSGDESEAQGAEQFINALKTDPKQATMLGGLFMSGAMGPDKFAETFKSLQGTQQAIADAPVNADLAKANLTIKQSEANNAPELYAANADTAKSNSEVAALTAANAPLKQSADIAKTQADIKESNAKTNASNVKTDALAQQDADNGLVDLGLPKPKRLPWSNIKDAKQKSILQTRVYSAAESALAKEREEVIGKNALSQDANRFLELNNKIPTGGFTDKFSLGQWANSFRDDYSEMQAITAKLVPLMRAPNSGSTSDFDARMFKQGTVGVDKPKETNKSVANALIARAEQADDYVTFKQDYLQQNGTLLGADQYWKEYANKNPIFDPKKPNSYTLNNNRKSYQEYFGGSASSSTGDVTDADIQAYLKAGGK